MSSPQEDLAAFVAAVTELKTVIWDDLLLPPLERIVTTLNRHLIYIGTLIKGAK